MAMLVEVACVFFKCSEPVYLGLAAVSHANM